MLAFKYYSGLSLGDRAGCFFSECMHLPVLRQYSGLLRVLTMVLHYVATQFCTRALSTVKGGSCPPPVSPPLPLSISSLAVPLPQSSPHMSSVAWVSVSLPPFLNYNIRISG